MMSVLSLRDPEEVAVAVEDRFALVADPADRAIGAADAERDLARRSGRRLTCC